MKVIKVLQEDNGKLVSTFASGDWLKEYAEGVETKPDIGYLFAYSSESIAEAKHDFRNADGLQYWLADAEVVCLVASWEIDVCRDRWAEFWEHFVLPRKRVSEYLLCSSITLIKELT